MWGKEREGREKEEDIDNVEENQKRGTKRTLRGESKGEKEREEGGKGKELRLGGKEKDEIGGGRSEKKIKEKKKRKCKEKQRQVKNICIQR